ncbi:hypothetical protein ACVIJ6_006172 [Bradyrhizobium sp. USDA 4369]
MLMTDPSPDGKRAVTVVSARPAQQAHPPMSEPSHLGIHIVMGKPLDVDGRDQARP